jgi:hypothetical protein
MRAIKPRSMKPFSYGDRSSALELWKSKLSPRTISAQLDMSKATLKRILAFARAVLAKFMLFIPYWYILEMFSMIQFSTFGWFACVPTLQSHLILLPPSVNLPVF